MRAVRLHQRGGPDVLRVDDVPSPEPRPGEVVVEVQAAGVNFADVMQRQGTYPLPTRLPLTPGLEAVGRICALGEGVSGLEVGARVMGMTRGAYAEKVAVRVANVVPLPASLPSPEATALLVQGTTARLMLEDAAPLNGGERVLVHAAAGGVGMLLVQLARRMGAGQVIATAGSEEKLALARALGAQVALNYREPDWPERVRSATSGEGADVIFEMVGGETLRKSLACLAPFGRLVTFGMASGESGSVNPMELVFKNQSLIGFALTGVSAERSTQACCRLVEDWREGHLQVKVGGTFPLERAAEAHRLVEDRGSVGKVVLVP